MSNRDRLRRGRVIDPRGELVGIPLTEAEHTFLYERAMQGSRKDAVTATGTRYHAAHHTMATIFAKLGVEDIISAFWAKGWMRPLPYGVTEADVRAEQRAEGETTEQIEAGYWKRANDKTIREHPEREHGS